MRVLMVPTSNRPESRTALTVASDLALSLDANIAGCHLRPHRDLNKDYKPKGLPLFGSANHEWLEELSKKSSTSAARQAEKMFTEIVTDAGIEVARKPNSSGTGSLAIWQEKVGSPDKLMSVMGPVADLTILSRPTANGHVARLFVLAALMHTSRPILLLPPKQSRAPGKRIAIAWNQSAEVSRVVSACMPMLKAAEQVTIISCGTHSQIGPKAGQLKTYLQHYGVKASVQTTPGRKEENELLGVYRDSKSDLLLMGAYSRSRFREIIFGGMTQYMLWKAKIPVIMQHT
jgi:nucleotide-binding universal stress UspA family protein